MTNENRAMIKELFKEGFYVWEIAKVLDITESEVVKVLNLR